MACISVAPPQPFSAQLVSGNLHNALVVSRRLPLTADQLLKTTIFTANEPVKSFFIDGEQFIGYEWIMDDDLLITVEQVVEALGGTNATAAIAHIGPPAVSNWKSRGQIPSDMYFVLLEALKRSGKPMPDPSLFGFVEIGC